MYQPLPHQLTVQASDIQGLGLFATELIEADTILGISHVANINFQHGYIRTPLGAFYNHSTSPNCRRMKGIWCDTKVAFLVTIRDIRAGEELTSTYSLYDIPETQGTL
jgi:SET domain-containing protein